DGILFADPLVEQARDGGIPLAAGEVNFAERFNDRRGLVASLGDFREGGDVLRHGFAPQLPDSLENWTSDSRGPRIYSPWTASARQFLRTKSLSRAYSPPSPSARRFWSCFP